jgi:hypothetical protein
MTKGMLTYNAARDRIHRVDGDTFVVPSSRGGWWTVNIGNPQTCECEDFIYRADDLDLPCRHIVAACIAAAARRSGVVVRSIPAAGDPFKVCGSRRLRELADRYHHELMDDEERQELRDRVTSLRRRLSR